MAHFIILFMISLDYIYRCINVFITFMLQLVKVELIFYYFIHYK